MSAVHHFNQGIIGPNNQAIYPAKGGVWNLSYAPWETFTDPVPVSTDIGFTHDEPDSGNEYNYAARNLTVFYTDAYGTTTHLDQGSTKGSYTDVRNIGNDLGSDNANSFLVSNSNSKLGYKWQNNARIKGFKAYGKYSSRTFSNNGTLDIFTWDGTNWTVLESNVDITNGGTVDWQSTTQTYNFAGGNVLCKGLAIEANSVSTYWAINYFAPIDYSNTAFLGHN